MPLKLKNSDALAIRRQQQKMCNRRRYNTMKNDPEMLEIEKIKRRQRYLKQKEAKKEKSFHDLREQRKKWRENSKRYRQRKKEEAVEEEKVTPFETIHIQALADLDHFETKEPDIKLDNPLPYCPQIQAEVRKVRYAELQKRKKLLRIIATLKKREKSQRKHIQKLKCELIHMRAMISPHEPQLDSDDKSESEERESPTVENVIKFYSENTNSVIRTGKEKIITRNEGRKQKSHSEKLNKAKRKLGKVVKKNTKRVSKIKKQQRGWVFVGPVKDKPIENYTAHVKEEPQWETDSDTGTDDTDCRGTRGAHAGDAERACLQMDIDIKQEIEVGPEQIQPQDIYYCCGYKRETKAVPSPRQVL